MEGFPCIEFSREKEVKCFFGWFLQGFLVREGNWSRWGLLDQKGPELYDGNKIRGVRRE